MKHIFKIRRVIETKMSQLLKEKSPHVTTLMLDPSKETENFADLNPRPNCSYKNLKKDGYKLALLIYMYFLQGIPYGIKFTLKGNQSFFNFE